MHGSACLFFYELLRPRSDRGRRDRIWVCGTQDDRATRDCLACCQSTPKHVKRRTTAGSSQCFLISPRCVSSITVFELPSRPPGAALDWIGFRPVPSFRSCFTCFWFRLPCQQPTIVRLELVTRLRRITHALSELHPRLATTTQSQRHGVRA